MNKFVFIAAVVLSQLSASAFAQATRAEVKSDAASANKAHAIPSGELTKEPKAKSTKDRAEVKKDAASANKAHAIESGEVGKESKTKSTKARAEVKAETKDAVKKGDMPAAGEGVKK